MLKFTGHPLVCEIAGDLRQAAWNYAGSCERNCLRGALVVKQCDYQQSIRRRDELH